VGQFGTPRRTAIVDRNGPPPGGPFHRAICGFPATSIRNAADAHSRTRDEGIPRLSTHEKFRVVIAGGGVAALEAMVALRELAEDRVDVTLVAPDNVFAYRPLAVAEPFGFGAVARFPLATLTAGCGARHEQGALQLVSPDAHSIYTSRSRTLEYDALLVALGARVREGLPGAITFGGPNDMRAIEMLLEDLESGLVRRAVFAVPTGIAWTLPLYELALLAAERVADAHIDAELTLVTPEELPLGVFGAEASATVRSLLDDRGIVVRTGVHPASYADGRLDVVGGDPVAADWVLTLPRLSGRTIEGIPQDKDGFVETDAFGRIKGVGNVYAAGDITTFPVKQGGIAAQQADASAEAIAAEAGAEITPKPFHPVLRGLLLTGGRPAFLRAEISGGHGAASIAQEPLWWPAGKIAARYLGPYLAERARSASGTRYEPPRLIV
jgi:sulfide:quinone oxidoreductase